MGITNNGRNPNFDRFPRDQAGPKTKIAGLSKVKELMILIISDLADCMIFPGFNAVGG
jgi:hypothetical protein